VSALSDEWFAGMMIRSLEGVKGKFLLTDMKVRHMEEMSSIFGGRKMSHRHVAGEGSIRDNPATLRSRGQGHYRDLRQAAAA
jgi:hypothetical protein